MIKNITSFILSRTHDYNPVFNITFVVITFMFADQQTNFQLKPAQYLPD